jgi:hypothetical protein
MSPTAKINQALPMWGWLPSLTVLARALSGNLEQSR